MGVMPPLPHAEDSDDGHQGGFDRVYAEPTGMRRGRRISKMEPVPLQVYCDGATRKDGLG